MDNRELLWKRYELSVLNYTKYLDFVIRLNLFYYGITGAIVSFYFSKNANNELIEYSLMLPIIFSFGLFLLSVFGSKALVVAKEEIDWLVKKLGLNYYVKIDGLIYLVRASAAFSILTMFALLYVFFSSAL